MEENSTRNFNNANNGQNSGSFSYGVNRPQPAPQNNNRQNDDERLKRLHQQLNQSGGNEKKKRKRRIIIWIILILLLVAIVGVGVYFFIKGQGELDLGSSIRLSIKTDERLDTDAGDTSITQTKIFPGQSFPVVVEVRNSNDFEGDGEALEVAPIFVRYKVELFIGDKSYNNVIVPTVQSSNWCIYNEETEEKPWDGYLYYFGRLVSQESVALFTALTFDFANTTNDMAGQSAVVKVTAEAIEAEAQNVEESSWASAPNAWINYVNENFGE